MTSIPLIRQAAPPKRAQSLWTLANTGRAAPAPIESQALPPTPMSTALTVGEAVKVGKPSKRGRKPALSLEQKQRLPSLLGQGSQHYGFMGDFWTYERVAVVILREFGVTYSVTAVRMTLKQIAYDLSIPDRRTRYRARAREQQRTALKRDLAQAFGYR